MPVGKRETGAESPVASPARGTAWLAAALDRPRLLTLLDQGVVAAASFGTTLILGRVCGKEELGLYLVALTLLGLVMEVQEVLIWSPYTYFRPRLPPPQVAAYTGSALVQQVGSSLLALPVLGLASHLLIRHGGHPGVATIFATLLLTGTCIFLQEFSRRLYFAGLEMGKALGLDLMASALKIGGLLFLAWLGSLSASRALWVFCLAGAVAGVLWLADQRRELAFSLPGARQALGQHWHFGRWLLGANLALYVSTYAFPWFVAVWRDLQEVGLLAAYLSIVAFVNPLVVGSRNFLTPKAARVFATGTARDQRQFIITNTALVGALAGGICLLITLGGDLLVRVLYGAAFAGQGLLLMLLVAQAWLGALPLAVDCGIWALGRPDINCKIYLVRLLSTLTVGLLLVYSLGLVGAAAGMLLNSLLVVALQGWCYLKLASSRTLETV